MRCQNQIFVRLYAHSVYENSLLVENHELMENLDHYFSILQESWHVYSILEIVNQSSLIRIWSVENFDKLLKLVCPVNIVKSIGPFKLKRSSHPILPRSWISLQLVVNQVLWIHNAIRIWFSIAIVEIENLRLINRVVPAQILIIIVRRKVL